MSPPIVPFRETAVQGVGKLDDILREVAHLTQDSTLIIDMAPVKNSGKPRGTVVGSLQAGLLTFVIRAVPLPSALTTFLLANSLTIKRLHRVGSGVRGELIDDDLEDHSGGDGVGVGSEAAVKVEDFWATLDGICREEGKEWKDAAQEVWAFGPRRVGANMLIDKTKGIGRS